MTFSFRACGATVLLLAASSLAAQADSSVNVYLSAPFTQTAGSSGLPTSDGTPTGTANANNTPNTLGFSNTSTEAFEETAQKYTSLTSSATGATFTAGNGGFSILPNGQYGGGGQGNYLGVPQSSPTTITFNTPVGYFGLLWCAVDAGNSLTFYDQGGVAIGTINATTFSSLLPKSGTIKAVNGNTYNTGDYYGQPTGTASTANRQNANEQYAYLNFVAQGNTLISKIVESENSSAIFESDNYSILTTAPAVTNSSPLVFVTAIPEPAVWVMIAASAGLMGLAFRRRAA